MEQPRLAYSRFNQLFYNWCRFHRDGNPYEPFKWVHDDWSLTSRKPQRIKSVMLIGNYCHINTRDGMTNCWVDPTEPVLKEAQECMLPVADDETHFSIVVDGEEARIYIKHGKIIGSRFLARIKTDTIPEEVLATVVG